MENSKYLLVLVILLSFYTYSEARSITSRYHSRGPVSIAYKSSFADGILRKYGYLPEVKRGALQSYEVRQDAIRNFQRMTGLPVTGEVDQATVRKMSSPRCGMPDMVPEGELSESRMAPMHILSNGSRARTMARPENFFAPGYKWTKKRLTWRISRYSRDLSRNEQRRAMYDAFKMWSDQTPLTFNEISGGEADINIDFEIGEHGDGQGNAFDGAGGVLAHAFYPEHGQTHFDDAEQWTAGTTQGINLWTVAAHEFGHALGLGHSNIPTALMAPYYQGYNPNLVLDADDIGGIQSLYGSKPLTPAPTKAPIRTTTTRRTTTPRRTTTTPRPPVQPNGPPHTCSIKFDAVMQALDTKIHIFRQKWVWRVDKGKGLDAGYPKQISSEFPGAPNGIGAAVTSWRTRYTYFFKGKKVWKFYGNHKVQMKTIRTTGYPSNIMSAFISRDGKIYILSNDKYWIFDEYKMDLSESRGRALSSIWPGIPNGIEAAVRLRDGYVYFIKGNMYRKYSEYYGRVEQGYPKPKAAPWMGRICSQGGQEVPR